MNNQQIRHVLLLYDTELNNNNGHNFNIIYTNNISLLLYPANYNTNNNNSTTDNIISIVDNEYACAMLGIPYELSYEDFDNFIEAFKNDIKSITIVIDNNATTATDNIKSSKIAIIKFYDLSTTLSFSSMYNNLYFPTLVELDVPPCITVIIDSIHYKKCNNSIVSISDDINHNLNVSIIRLPTCTVCLRRIKDSLSRIEGCNRIPVSNKHAGNKDRCNVCKIYSESISKTYNQSSPNKIESSSTSANNLVIKCYNCDVTDNLWVCLICGYIGCGRYTSRHAHAHFLQSEVNSIIDKHSFSLELATGRIWDYLNDTFVHNEPQSLIINDESNVTNIISYDNSIIKPYQSFLSYYNDEITLQQLGINNNNNNNKLKLIADEYELLLESQLNDQQLYFEKLLAKETMKAINTSANNNNNNNNDLISDNEMNIIENKKIEISIIENELFDIFNEIKQAENTLKLLRKKNEKLLKDQKLLKEIIINNDLKENEINIKNKEIINDLELQIKDLSFYSNTQKNIMNIADDTLREEINNGQMIVNTTTTSDNNGTNTTNNKGNLKKNKK